MVRNSNFRKTKNNFGVCSSFLPGPPTYMWKGWVEKCIVVYKSVYSQLTFYFSHPHYSFSNCLLCSNLLFFMYFIISLFPDWVLQAELSRESTSSHGPWRKNHLLVPPEWQPPPPTSQHLSQCFSGVRHVLTLNPACSIHSTMRRVQTCILAGEGLSLNLSL